VRLAENYETAEGERDDEPCEGEFCKVWRRERRREGGGEREDEFVVDGEREAGGRRAGYQNERNERTDADGRSE